MSNYNDAYKNYYSAISSKVNPQRRSYNTASIDELFYKKQRKSRFNIGDLFIKQLVGAIVLFVLAFTIKMIPSEEAQSVYTFSKEVVKADFNFESFIDYIKNFNIMDYINKIDLGV